MDLHFFQNLHRKHRSSMSSLNDELTFLQQFLKTNFYTLFSEFAITRVQLLHDKLSELQVVQQNTWNSLDKHQINLYSKSIDFLKLESERIDDGIQSLIISFKSLKIEIFAYYKEYLAVTQDSVGTNLQLH